MHSIDCDTKLQIDTIMQAYEEGYVIGKYTQKIYNSQTNEEGFAVCGIMGVYIVPLITYDVYDIETPNGHFYVTVFEFVIQSGEVFYGASTIPIVEKPNLEPEPMKGQAI